MKYLLDRLHENELSFMRNKEADPSRNDGMCVRSITRSHVPADSIVNVTMETSPPRTGIKTRLRGAAASQSPPHGSIASPPVVTSQHDDRPLTLVERTFGGLMQITTRCCNCGHESQKSDPFIDLPLSFSDGDVTRSFSLQQMISFFLSSEDMTGDNRYFCDACDGLQDAKRTVKINKAPQYLILTLLRFQYDTVLKAKRKVFNDVTYPKALVVECGDEPEAYGLVAVVIHSGLSSDCGHYYTYARHNRQLSDLGGIKKVFESVTTGDQQVPEMPCAVLKTEKSDYFADTWCNFNDSIVSFTNYSQFR